MGFPCFRVAETEAQKVIRNLLKVMEEGAEQRLERGLGRAQI